MPLLPPHAGPVTATLVTLATVATLAVATAPTAAAQPAGHAPPPARVGWEFGLGLYGGEINCENDNGDFCDGVTEAGGFDLHASYFFRPAWGVYVDLWPMFHKDADWSFTHNVVTVGARWRPVPILTLTAGVGSAQARLRYDVFGFQGEQRTEVVSAVLFAAGLEVLRGKSFAVDLQARAGIGFYSEDNNDDGNPDIVGRNLGLGAAINWF